MTNGIDALSLIDSFTARNTLYDKIIDITFNATINQKEDMTLEEANNQVISNTARGVASSISEVRNKAKTGDEATIRIPTTGLGVKPDIAISFKTLQGQICYNCTVKIKNFKCNYNIRKFTSMDITAGYRDGPRMTFHSPIFSSYRESANPDGVTVFEGVIVGSVDSLFSNRQIIIDIYQPKITLGEFIRKCLTDSKSPKDMGVDVDYGNCGVLMDEEIIIQKYYYKAANGYALILWLAEQANQLSVAKGYGPVVTYIKENKVVFSLLHPDAGKVVLKRDMRILNLDKVTMAEFNGTTLTVKAPWHPYLQPLSLFYMAPNVYGGTNLPNIIRIEDMWKDPDNVYQVITEEVNFETNGSTNEMTIFATPLKQKEVATNLEDAWKAEQIAKVTDSTMKHIVIGEEPQAETDKKWTDVPFSLEALDYYTVAKDDTLTSIAKKLYEGVTPYRVRYAQLPANWDEANEGLITKPTPGREYTPAIHPMYFWPLIVAATYKRMQYKLTGNGEQPNININPDNPDLIQEKWVLAVPRINGLTGHEDLKELFGRMAKAMQTWQTRQGNTEWREIAKIYVYMGGTETI